MPFNTYPSNSVGSDGASSSGGSGGTVRLAQDLNFPSSLTSPTEGVYFVSGLNTVGGLEILNLSGKYEISFLRLSGMTIENVDISLVVDGVQIWDDSFVPSQPTLTLYGSELLGVSRECAPFSCKSSLSLTVGMASDTNITFHYMVRKIL